MFFVVALIILIISFLIALVSLLREQRKVHKINQQRHRGDPIADTAEKITFPIKTAVEPIESREEVSGEFLIEKPPEEPDQTATSEKRVDEETVPFPWEEKAGANNPALQLQEEIVRINDRLPDIGKGLPNHPVSEQSQVLDSKNHDSEPTPGLGLNGSVSLKDLKK